MKHAYFIPSGRFVRAAVLFTLLSQSLHAGATDADPALPTIFTAEPQRLTCRPGYGVKVNLHWAAVPLKKDLHAYLEVIDSAGNSVAWAQHDLPTPTSQWHGDVTYSPWLCLPELRPQGKKTGGPIPDGTYSVVAGLTGKPPLNAGPGVVKDSHGYQIAILVVDSAAPIPALGAKSLDLTGYHVTFRDEFEDLSVSAHGPCGRGPGKTRWMAHTPYNGDFGDAHFADPSADFPFTVKDGILSIEVRKNGAKWQGGLLSSADPQANGFAQKFGYFEMRAKLPKGTGTWPGFWLLGLPTLQEPKDKSIVQIEFDVLEQYGHWPNRLCTTTHLWPKNGKPHEAIAESFVVPGMTDDFHTYGVMVDEESVIYFYDGVELRRHKTPDAGKVPLYVLVDLTLGPGWPLDRTPSPSVMQVDYVRAYAKGQ